MSALRGGGRPHIVLIGDGHAHLYLMPHSHRLADADIPSVQPGAVWYCGMPARRLCGARAPALPPGIGFGSGGLSAQPPGRRDPAESQGP